MIDIARDDGAVCSNGFEKPLSFHDGLSPTADCAQALSSADFGSLDQERRVECVRLPVRGVIFGNLLRAAGAMSWPRQYSLGSPGGRVLKRLCTQ